MADEAAPLLGGHSDVDVGALPPQEAPLLGASPPRNVPLMGGRGAHGQPAWLTVTPGTLSPAAPGPGSLAGFEAQQELHRQLMKRSQSTAALREARARRTAWIIIDSEGKRSFMHADKRSITHRLGLNIPIRDLRLMDFNLLTSDTGSIMVREDAIIFTLEHVRLIITADKVLVPREGYEHNPLANRFVDVLEEAIADWARQQQAHKEQLARVAEEHHSDFEDDVSGTLRSNQEILEVPFELVALEAALKEVVNSAAIQVKELEGVALPALDALTKSVSTANLERVRKVKTRHQRLVIRVETLRDELQRFLHDDDDMRKMCLSRKKELEQLYAAAAAAVEEAQRAAQASGELAPSLSMGPVGSVPRRSPLQALLMQQQAAAAAAGAAGAAAASPGVGTMFSTPHRDLSAGTAAGLPLAQTGPSDEEYEDDAEDVENLLESYFAQVDGLWDKLVSIGEYVKDTEEYINIELDSNRNRLIRLDIILTAATFAIAPFNLIAGILGENLVIPEFLHQSVKGFWVLNGAALLTVISLFFAIVAYMRHRKLI